MSALEQLRQQKPDIIRRYMQADDRRGLFQAANTMLPLGLLWWAVGLGAPISPWLPVLLVLPLSLFTLRILVLMHEAGHGSLFRSHRLNRLFGFAFGVIAGMPQYVWSQHHNFHHAHNGDWQVYRGPLTTPSVAEFAAMSPSQQRTYCWTRHIALAPLGGFLYLLFNPRFTWMVGSVQMLVHIVRTRRTQPGAGWRQRARTFRTRYWKSAREYRHMTWNNLVLLSLWLVMSAALGAGLFFAVYAATIALAGGAGIVLFTVQHNFRHSYATDTARWDYDAGALHGTSFLVLPAWLNWFTANIAYHHVHHLSSAIPNYRLRQCHESHAALFAGVTRIRLSQIGPSLKYILWDQDAQQIISLAEYRSQLPTAAVTSPT